MVRQPIQKGRAVRIFLALVAAAVVIGFAGPAASEAWRLRYDYSCPETYYLVNVKTGMSVVTQNLPTSTDYKPPESLQEMVAWMVMKSVGGEGEHKLEVFPHKVRIYMILGDKKRAMPLRKKDLKYFRYTLTLDDAGRVLTIKLPEEFSKIGEGVDQALARDFGFNYQQIFPPLPGKKLAIDDTWTNEFETTDEADAVNVTTKAKALYTFKGTKEMNGVQCLFVKFETRYAVGLLPSEDAPEGVTITGKGSGKGSGVLYFHPSRRQIEASGLRSTFEMNLHVQDQDKSLDQVITRRAEVKYERIEKLPEEPKDKKKEELPKKPSDLKPQVELEPLEDVTPLPSMTPPPSTTPSPSPSTTPSPSPSTTP